jgi:cell division protein FtsB
LVLFIGLQYRLWLADGGILELRRIEQSITEQKARNEKLRARNRTLAAEVRDLKNGLDAIEARARAELGMVGENETFYRVVEAKRGRGEAASR